MTTTTTTMMLMMRNYLPTCFLSLFLINCIVLVSYVFAVSCTNAVCIPLLCLSSLSWSVFLFFKVRTSFLYCPSFLSPLEWVMSLSLNGLTRFIFFLTCHCNLVYIRLPSRLHAADLRSTRCQGAITRVMVETIVEMTLKISSKEKWTRWGTL